MRKRSSSVLAMLGVLVAVAFAGRALAAITYEPPCKRTDNGFIKVIVTDSDTSATVKFAFGWKCDGVVSPWSYGTSGTGGVATPFSACPPACDGTLSVALWINGSSVTEWLPVASMGNCTQN